MSVVVFQSTLEFLCSAFFPLRVAYGTSKIGVTALSKIQARAFSQDSREDILINAVSYRIININYFKTICLTGVSRAFFCDQPVPKYNTIPPP